MNSDAFFAMGSTHSVCQDYARGGVTRPGSGRPSGHNFAVVSDGCSSSAHTDVGARLLTMAAMHRFQVYGARFDPEWVLWRAHDAGVQLGVDRGCLDATLLCACTRDDGVLEVNATGDGVIAARRRDGRPEVWCVDYHGAPAYLSYLLDSRRLHSYFAQGGGARGVVHYVDGRRHSETTHHVRERYGKDGPAALVWTNCFSPQDYDVVLLLSDGALSLQVDGCTETMSIHEVVGELLAIKGSRGEFVTRRCRRFLRDCRKHSGWRPADDLAVAGVYLGAL